MRYGRPLALGLGSILLVAVVFAPAAGTTRLISALHDTAHGPVFGCVALLALFILQGESRLQPAPGFRRYVLAFAAAAFLGVATEVLQVLTHRDATVGDAARDFAGAAAFLLLHAAFDARRTRGTRPRRRVAALVVGLSLLASLATPLLRTLYEYRVRDRQFPVLADFSGERNTFFIHEQRVTTALIALPAAWAARPGELALQVRLAGAHYPGLQMEEPVPDWRGYSTLAIDLTNPDERPLQLGLRVHDARHNNQYEDRFNTSLRLAPRSRRTFRIPIAQIEAAPQTRRLNIAEIAGVVLFGIDPSGPRQLYVSRLWLE